MSGIFASRSLTNYVAGAASDSDVMSRSSAGYFRPDLWLRDWLARSGALPVARGAARRGSSRRIWARPGLAWATGPEFLVAAGFLDFTIRPYVSFIPGTTLRWKIASRNLSNALSLCSTQGRRLWDSCP